MSFDITRVPEACSWFIKNPLPKKSFPFEDNLIINQPIITEVFTWLNTYLQLYTMAYASAAAAALNTVPTAQPAAWVALCTQTAPIISSAVFMAPIPTIAKIRSSRSTGSLPLLPYSSMVVNAFLWMVYGILKQDSKIWSPNAFGLFMGVNYCLQFQKFVSKNASNLPGKMSQHVRVGSLMILFTMIVAAFLDKMKAASLIGKMGVVVCVVLFASPLAALKNVLATKSAKSIPLP